MHVPLHRRARVQHRREARLASTEPIEDLCSDRLRPEPEEEIRYRPADSEEEEY